MAENSPTLRQWAACHIAFEATNGIEPFFVSQDGSWDENVGIVQNGIGDITLQLLPDRPLNRRKGTASFMLEHDPFAIILMGACNIEHLDDLRKRIRIFAERPLLSPRPADLPFFLELQKYMVANE